MTLCCFPRFTQQENEANAQANVTPPHDLSEIELSDGSGNKITVRVATPDLTAISFAANTPEAKKGSWAWYTQTNYRGTPRIISANSGIAIRSCEGMDTVLSEEMTGVIQSVRPLMGQIILYANFNYTGASLVLTESAPNLGAFGWNDSASSARVINGKWQLYQGTDFEGTSRTTSGNPEALSPIPGLPNDSISSVRFIPEA